MTKRQAALAGVAEAKELQTLGVLPGKLLL